MANAKHKYMDVDVIAFLEEKMKGNTKHYQSDFELDKNILLRCTASDRPEDKTLLWLSRPNGTHCLKEREAFIRDTSSHITWRYYAEQVSAGIIAYAVELTGSKSGVPKGNVYELDYLAHAAGVAQKAVACSEVQKIFEDGFVGQASLDRSSYGYWAVLTEEHGQIVDSVALPEDSHLLSFVLAEQKADRNKLKAIEVPSKSIPELPVFASALSPEDIDADKHLYTCCADKEYTFLVRGANEADAEKTGENWYAKEVFEPGHFSCRKTSPNDIERLSMDDILESKEFLRQISAQKPRKLSLQAQIHSAEAKAATANSSGILQKESARSF